MKPMYLHLLVKLSSSQSLTPFMKFFIKINEENKYMQDSLLVCYVKAMMSNINKVSGHHNPEFSPKAIKLSSPWIQCQEILSVLWLPIYLIQKYSQLNGLIQSRGDMLSSFLIYILSLRELLHILA